MTDQGLQDVLPAFTYSENDLDAGTDTTFYDQTTFENNLLGLIFEGLEDRHTQIRHDFASLSLPYDEQEYLDRYHQALEFAATSRFFTDKLAGVRRSIAKNSALKSFMTPSEVSFEAVINIILLTKLKGGSTVGDVISLVNDYHPELLALVPQMPLPSVAITAQIVAMTIKILGEEAFGAYLYGNLYELNDTLSLRFEDLNITSPIDVLDLGDLVEDESGCPVLCPKSFDSEQSALYSLIKCSKISQKGFVTFGTQNLGGRVSYVLDSKLPFMIPLTLSDEDSDDLLFTHLHFQSMAAKWPDLCYKVETSQGVFTFMSTRNLDIKKSAVMDGLKTVVQITGLHQKTSYFALNIELSERKKLQDFCIMRTYPDRINKDTKAEASQKQDLLYSRQVLPSCLEKIFKELLDEEKKFLTRSHKFGNDRITTDFLKNWYTKASIGELLSALFHYLYLKYAPEE